MTPHSFGQLWQKWELMKRVHPAKRGVRKTKGEGAADAQRKHGEPLWGISSLENQ